MAAQNDTATDTVSEVSDTTTCTTDADCPKQPFYICDASLCRHKDIFPIFPLEFAGVIILPVLLGMANVGGIGGGGLIIPFLMTFWGFDTKEAIAISNMTIFVGAITRYLYNYKQKHPEKRATQIDYGIVIVMMPLVMVGSFTGVLVNIMLPSLMLAIILTALLAFLSLQSMFKGREMYVKETKMLKDRANPNRSLNAKLEQVDEEPYLPDIRHFEADHESEEI